MYYIVNLNGDWLTVSIVSINSLTTETKIADFANSIDLDEVAHNEPTYLQLHSLPASL